MKKSEISYFTNFSYKDLVNFLKFYDIKSENELFETYEDELVDFLNKNSVSKDGGNYKAIDMIDLLKYYDEKDESDCFDTFEQEVDEFIECSKELKLGSNRVNVSLSQEDIDNIKDGIETKLAVMDLDDVEESNYDSKADFEHALYNILNIITSDNE